MIWQYRIELSIIMTFERNSRMCTLIAGISVSPMPKSTSSAHAIPIPLPQPEHPQRILLRLALEIITRDAQRRDRAPPVEMVVANVPFPEREVVGHQVEVPVQPESTHTVHAVHRADVDPVPSSLRCRLPEPNLLHGRVDAGFGL